MRPAHPAGARHRRGSSSASRFTTNGRRGPSTRHARSAVAPRSGRRAYIDPPRGGAPRPLPPVGVEAPGDDPPPGGDCIDAGGGAMVAHGPSSHSVAPRATPGQRAPRPHHATRRDARSPLAHDLATETTTCPRSVRIADRPERRRGERDRGSCHGARGSARTRHQSGPTPRFPRRGRARTTTASRCPQMPPST